MNETLQAIILASVAMVGFGLNNGIAKKYAGKVGPLRLITYPRVFVVLILAVLTAITWQNVILDYRSIVLGIFVVLVSYFGLFFFNRSVEVGKVGVVVPISAARILVSVAVGMFFLEDSLSFIQISAVVVIFVGIALLSVNFRQLKNSDLLDINSGVPFAVLCAVFWGATMPLFGHFGSKIGVVFFTFLTELTVFSESIVHIKLKRQKLVLPSKVLRENLFGMLFLAVSGVIAGLAVTAGFGTGKIGVVAAISGSSPVVSVITAQVLFKEKLDLQQYIAIGLVILGIITISLG